MVDFVVGFPRPSGNSGVGEDEVEDYVGGCEGWWEGTGRLDAEEEGLEACEEGGHCVGYDVLDEVSWFGVLGDM